MLFTSFEPQQYQHHKHTMKRIGVPQPETISDLCISSPEISLQRGFSVLAADKEFAKPDYVIYQFRNPLIAEVELHLNGRIRDLYFGSALCHGTAATWSLFSQSMNDHYFDMGLVRVFYWYGIVPGIVFVASNIWLIWRFYKNKDGMGLVIFLIFFPSIL